MKVERAEILVVGSGAGGAVVAATLAEAGREVLVIEEGPEVDTSGMATHTPDAMRTLYRQGGLTPILGKPSMAFVEGCCVGGSTEINSAFWHRLPEAVCTSWAETFDIHGLDSAGLARLFEELEQEMKVGVSAAGALCASSRLMKAGAEALSWKVAEVPRAQHEHPDQSAYAPGAKRSMSRSYLPRARAAGARVLADCRAGKIVRKGDRVTDVLAVRTVDGGTEPVRLEAGTVFVCGGAMQSAVLLRSSGFTRNVGDQLHVHPMIKAAAEFDEVVDAHLAPLPVFQVKEFGPDVTLGGSVFTPGFLALTLSDNWLQNEAAMERWRHMATYYATSRGQGCGSIRAVPGSRQAFLRYQFAPRDEELLNTGLARLCELLFAAGARRVFPGIRTRASFAGPDDCRTFMRTPVRLRDMSLSVLHVFGSCPMGEKMNRCGADSYGRVHGTRNLYVADASLLPGPTGVNPQGTVMAVALRNARHFLDAV
jgi:choline dehydrogenase-like flavoprotein